MAVNDGSRSAWYEVLGCSVAGSWLGSVWSVIDFSRRSWTSDLRASSMDSRTWAIARIPRGASLVVGAACRVVAED